MNVQMSYLIGALVIFTMLAVVFNQKENFDLESRLEHEAVGVASELGNALLIKLSKMPFDENTVSEIVDLTVALTAANSLGPESGEDVVSKFDDIDDYNYFKGGVSGGEPVFYIQDTLNKLGVFYTKVRVNYIKKDTPDIVSTTPQFYKIINIEVNNDYLNIEENGQFLREPLKLFFIASY